MILVVLTFGSANLANAALISSYDFNSDLSDTLEVGNDLTSHVISGLTGSVSGGRYHFLNN